MLAMADTKLELFLPIFASTGARVAFISPTPTGMEKSIMDAIGDVRILLKESGIHNYDLQGQGQDRCNPQSRNRNHSYILQYPYRTSE